MEAAGIEPASPLTQAVTSQGDSNPSISGISEYISFLRERDADLARIVDAWSQLPDHIKATILVLVKSARVPNDASE